VGVENFCPKLPKGTFLRQIWSNKSFGVCGSDVVLTLYGDEKKSTRESPLENRVVCNTTSLPRRRDVAYLINVDNFVMKYRAVNGIHYFDITVGL